MTTFGIDISHYQDGIDLSAVARHSATEFVVAKATTGSTGQDSNYAAYRAEAERNGLLFAAYHWITGSSSPVTQAQNAFNVVGGDVPVFIDIERNPFDPQQPTMAHVTAFVAAAGALGLRVNPVLYLPEWYWVEMGRPNVSAWGIWQSDYGPNDGAYPGDDSDRWAFGSREAVILQYTSRGHVKGYGRFIDVDAYRGTRADLARTGWFKDYSEDVVATKEEIQAWVANTPIVIDWQTKETQPLHRVLRRLLKASVAEATPEQIASAVVAALPESGGGLTVEDVQSAVANVFRQGIDAQEA